MGTRTEVPRKGEGGGKGTEEGRKEEGKVTGCLPTSFFSRFSHQTARMTEYPYEGPRQGLTKPNRGSAGQAGEATQRKQFSYVSTFLGLCLVNRNHNHTLNHSPHSHTAAIITNTFFYL